MAVFTLIVGRDQNGNNFAFYSGPEADVHARVGDFEFSRYPVEDDGYDDGYDGDDVGPDDIKRQIVEAAVRGGTH